MRPSSKIGIIGGAVVLVAVAIGVRTAAQRPKPAPSPVEEAKAAETAVPPLAPAPPRLAAAIDASLPAAAIPKKSIRPKLLSETALLERLRKAQDVDDIKLSYELAREGQRRFPDSPDAPEFAAMVVKSLSQQGKLSEARAEAEIMVNKYPGTKWAREVERHTGAHPRVNQVPPR